MSLQFVLKPDSFDIVFPSFLRWLWRYSVAAIIIYFLSDFVNYQTNSMIVALVIVVLVASLLSIKHALIRVHTTKYSFFDTHVVAESGLLAKNRDSLPYKKISKVVNKTSLWNRLSGASDIVLKTTHEMHDLRLKSIKGADKVESRIYDLLRK